ncbi:MAG TPA: thioesterase domain-containing protein [Longimicrobium sp.]|nr:thioesterase domain-containing protein [Longimicrobium sp.]
MRRSSLNGWTVFPSPNPNARLRLFCFPYAGGGATIFATWPRALPPEVEVVAVQPPGREARIAEKPYGDLGQLVDAMLPQLLPHFDRPFAFYGHSNGWLMAFELARTLRRTGGPMPRHLFVGGRPAPQVGRDEENIHALPHDEFLAALRRYAGTPEEILQNAEIMELIEPVLRADFSLGETYHWVPEPPLDLPISAFAGERDDEVTLDEVEAWREQTTGAFRLHVFPGDHFFINGDRAMVLQEISRDLRPLLQSLAPAHAW